MTLFQKASCKQTRLLRKTSKNNSGLERSGLTREKDLKGIKKELRPEQEVERPKQETEREIEEETRLEWEVEREEKTEQ